MPDETPPEDPDERPPEPFVASLGEGLLAPSTIRMFGRPYAGLKLGVIGASQSSNSPLSRAFAKDCARGDHGLARIYGFSYLGNYFKLAEPVVFLVYGDGTPVISGSTSPDNTIDDIGIELKNEQFTEGVRMWAVDQLDISVRIDVTIGWMKDILLAHEMASDNNITGGDAIRRSDVVGRDGNLVGRDGNLVGRDGNLIGGSSRR